MKRWLLLLLVITVLATGTVGYASEEAPEVLRGIKWGMSPDEIIAIEGIAPTDDSNDEVIGFPDVKGGGLSAFLLYYFNEDLECYKATYVFREKHSNDNDYIADYDKLNKALTEKYGAPTAQDVIWKNDLFKDSVKDHGLAVSAGHVVYYTNFETEGTAINQMLIGDNYTINHYLTYTSTTVAPMATQEDNTL